MKKFTNFLKRKENGIDGMFVALGLVLIAVVVLILFRKEAMDLVTNVFGTMTGSINNLLNTTTP